MPEKSVTFDTETTGLDWSRGALPFMVQWATESQPNGVHAFTGPAVRSRRRGPERQTSAAARAALLKADELVGHNLPFDVHHVGAGLGWDLLARDVSLKDTATLARIVLPERRIQTEEEGRGYKLKDLSQTYVDPDAKDSEAILEGLAEQHGFRLHAQPGQQGYIDAAYYELWKLHPEEVEFYGREDTRLTRGLLPKLEAMLTDGTANIWQLEQAVMPVILGAETKGIRVAGDKAEPLRQEYIKSAEELKAKLDKQLQSGWEDNNETLADALLSAGVPLTEVTDSGQLATNKWALDKLKDKHPVIQDLFDYRQAGKFVSTYLDHFVGQEIIHPTFNQIGTWTGRMSAVQPNMQNVPVRAGKMIRELFLPRPGYAFVAIDYEQIEFRLLCYYLNGRKMIELMESGHDPFAQLAADVFGGSPEEYVKGAPKEEQRTVCKNTTYAVIYGAGGMKVAMMLGWGADSVYVASDWVVQHGYKQAGDPRSKRAESLIKKLKNALVGYGTSSKKYRKGLIGRIYSKVEEQGAVDTILGRHQWIGYDGGYRGLSGLIQGGAADIFKLGLIDAVEAVKPLGAYPLLFIHDEVVFEAPLGTEFEVQRVASERLEQAYPLRPALSVESHVAYNNWGEAK